MRYLFGVAIFITTIFFFTQLKQNLSVFDKPESPEAEDKTVEDSLKAIYRRELYFAAEGTNVDSIRYENWKQNYRFKQSLRSNLSLRSGMESFAGGLIQATWHERGPNNEAGDMREVDFLPSNESLYAISTAGHLWKGNLNGLDWTLLNDNVRFQPDELEVVPHNGGTRIFAIFGSGVDDKKIRYSDDEGQNWTTGTGFSFYDHWGNGRRLLTLSDNQTLYYLVNTWSGNPWGSVVQLYKTTNKGLSYTKVWQSDIGYDGNSEQIDLWKPYDSDQMYLVDNKTQQFYTVTHNLGTGATTISSPVSYSGQGVSTGKVSVSGRYNSSISNYELFIHTNSDKKVYKTVDGVTWTYLSTASSSVWRKGWLSDPDNNNLYAGGFQVNMSTNTTTWAELYADWWEYYKNTPTQKDYLHVDIMSLDFFKKLDGTPFIIILNHSGIHVTYDNFATTKNLGLNNLNVTTLYDQTTASDGFVYLGAQDKGNFKYGSNSKANFNMLSTDNMSTADGMLGVFFNSDQSFYAMIQNGNLYCYKNRNVRSSSSFLIPGTNKPGWINPMVATPDFTDNKAYVAGGNLTGGSGSYLITANVNISSGVSWNNTQFNYDFMANSNNGTSVIKAIGVAQSDYNRIYISTQDATFFSSTDQGTNWTKHTTAGLPSTMIPWDIKTSNTNANKVFVCGTGFSNTGVYQSNDGGATFVALSGSILLATFYEIALSDNEQFLYAATSEGPYVYVFSTATWHNLLGAKTPIVDFTSVDNIGSNIIRFGTYGRGIWDLELNNSTLPVELVSFKAKALDGIKTEVDWVTASEINVKSYIVEHSLNGKDFKTVGTVAAKGNSSKELRYSFTDNTPKIGVNYYRLKMIDNDETINYSSIQSVNFEEKGDIFKVYPNLIAQNDRFFVETYLAEPFTIDLYTIEGRLIFTQKNNHSTYIQANFPKGIYVYRLNSGQRKSVGKIIIQ
jgi:hypothetical protein